MFIPLHQSWGNSHCKLTRGWKFQDISRYFQILPVHVGKAGFSSVGVALCQGDAHDGSRESKETIASVSK